MAKGARERARPCMSHIVATLLALSAVQFACARSGAQAPSTLTSQAQQLAALGQESTGQVAGTATHIGQEINHEGQRQVGNLRKAADIAGAPIALGISSEGAALLQAAQVLGLPRLEQMLAGGSSRDASDDDSAPSADSPAESLPGDGETNSAPAPGPANDAAGAPAPEKDAKRGEAPTPAPETAAPKDKNAPAPGPSKSGGEGKEGTAPASAPTPAPAAGDGEAPSPASGAFASAPEGAPTSAKAGGSGPAAAPRARKKAAYVPDPEFKGKPLERTPEDIKSFKAMKKTQERRAKKGKKGESDDELPFPVIYLDQLQNLNDKQLYKIFHRGTGEIPSQISSKKFAFCDRPLTLTNSIERPSGWPSIPWPNADEIFATPQRLAWQGKFFVTYPNNETKLFNLIFFNNNLDVIANVTEEKGGYSGDGRDSFIVNYGATDLTPGRIARDEFRRVGPTIFLGRGFFWIDGKDLIPKYATSFEKAALDAIEPLTNATITAILNAQKLVRRVRNTNKYTDISYPPLKAFPFSFYFAVDCQDYRIPAVHYTPILTDAFANLNVILGYDAPFYRLPKFPNPYTDETFADTKVKYSAPDFKGYPKDRADAKQEDGSDSEAEAPPLDMNDPDTGVKFASKEEKEVDPYVLFPLSVPANETLGTQETEGFVKLPAAALEPAFGPFWAADTPGWAPAPAPEAEAEAEDGVEDSFASVSQAFTG